MSYRFKDGPDSMRSMGDKFDDRMMGGMEGDKPPRDDMDDHGRGGPRPPFRGRGPSPGRDKSYGDRDRQRDFYGRDDGPGRDRSPLRGGYDDRYPDRFKRDDGPYPRRDEMGRKDMGPRPYGDEPYDKYGARMEGRGRYDAPRPSGRYDRPDDQFRNRPFSYPNFPPYRGYYKPPPETGKINECEIIVINKHQRAYAEDIEDRLKNLNIQVDILFLKDEALLVQTIDDIARRGSLYAIVIGPLNETHGSVTLNILYGTPQEHRNMPLEDALKLVSRNFLDYVHSQREYMERDRLERGFYAGSIPADREIQFLLQILAEGRQVSLGELETVIKYLTERHERMKNTQGDRGPGPANQMIPPDMGGGQPPKMKEDMDMAQKEQDLQNRIMNIMNQGPPPEAGGGPMGQNKPLMSMGGIPGVGGDMMGPRPNQSQLSPGGIGGPGPNMMPGRGGMGPGPTGPNQPGGGPNQLGMGPNKQGMQQGPPGMGQNLPGMAQNQQPGMGQNQSGMAQNRSSVIPNQVGMDNLPNMSQLGDGVASQPSSSGYINFDNPSVKKALDSLMQSGPNLLETISMTSAVTPSTQDMQSSANKAPSGPGSGAMMPQRGSGNMGNMGNLGGMPQGGGNMAPMQGMGSAQNRNMMSQQGVNAMGGPPGMGMRQSQNMGPGSMQGMNNRSGSAYPGGPQGFGGGGPNMMGGNRPPYMGGGGGGPGGNQGMGSGGGSGGLGGPRRF